MLAKLSSPLYIALPMLATCIMLAAQMRRDWSTRSEWVRGPVVLATVFGSILALVSAVLWYLPNLDAALEHARIASEDTGLYGTQRGLAREVSEWSDRLGDATFLPRIAIAVAVIALIGALSLVPGKRLFVDRRALVGGICLAQVALTIVAFATQPNEEARVPCAGDPLHCGLGRSRRLAFTAPCHRSDRSVIGGVSPRDASRVRRATTRRAELLSARRAESGLGAQEHTGAARRSDMHGSSANDSSWWAPSIRGSTRTPSQCSRPSTLPASRGSATTRPSATRNQMWPKLGSASPTSSRRSTLSIDYGNPTNQLPPDLRLQASQVDAFNRTDHKMFRRVANAASFRVVPGSRSGGFVVFASAEGT